MYRAQSIWSGRYFSLRYHKEQKEYTGQNGIEKVQSNS